MGSTVQFSFSHFELLEISAPDGFILEYQLVGFQNWQGRIRIRMLRVVTMFIKSRVRGWNTEAEPDS